MLGRPTVPAPSRLLVKSLERVEVTAADLAAWGSRLVYAQIPVSSDSGANYRSEPSSMLAHWLGGS